jgi:hypothetical protein
LAVCYLLLNLKVNIDFNKKKNNCRFAFIVFISYSFIGSDKKRIANYKNDFFSPPLTCASCLGGINQGRREFESSKEL